MKKKWIYIVLMLVIVGVFFYMVLEKDEVKEPDTSQEDNGNDELVDEPNDDEKTPDEEVKIPEKPKDETDLSEIAVGKKLPDFTLKSLDGKDINLRELEGKMVMLNFWATSCPWCVKEMPDMQKLQDENEDLVVLAVNIDEKKSTVEEYIKEGGYEFEVVLDEGGKVAGDYMVIYMPTSYFVNKDGTLYGGQSGALTYEQMNSVIETMRDI